ncbi:YdcH family protein [Terrarubrum flagellatum]|uniref:YdcH family protein n=1 Tax=Terrirubrum flagellatum TaxID=2895980 RepID=UPI0031452973
MRIILDETERARLGEELTRLKEEHRDLDAAIHALERSGLSDQLQIQRLKKRKLVLKDKMGGIEDILTPDIIA